MPRPLIDEPTIEAARDRLRRQGHINAVRRCCKEEPDLHYAIARYAADALTDIDSACSDAREAAHQAVWEAVLLALEAYRLAHYRLWRGTTFGTLLEQLDPDLMRSPKKRGGGGGKDVAP